MVTNTALFYVFSAVLLLAAFRVITARSPVYAALFLVLAFFSAACVWILLHAEFLAIALVLVYVGAVMVLFLFVVMMLDINVEEFRARFTPHTWFGALIAGIVVFELVSVVWTRSLGMDVTTGAQAQPAGYSNTAELGKVLYTEYVYPFELAAVLLLIAIVAAISLTMRKRAGLKLQDITKQVAVRSKDRVRIVQVAAEKTSQTDPGAAQAETPPKGTAP